MNKKVKISLGVIAASSILAMGGTLYYLVSEIKKTEEAFLKSVEKISISLPNVDSLKSNTAKVEIIHLPGEKGWLSQSGTYLLNYTNELNKTLDAKISLKYKAELTLRSLLTRQLEATMEGIVEGNLIKTYQIKTNDKSNLTFKLMRIKTHDGNFILIGNPDKYSFVVPKPEPIQNNEDNEYYTKTPTGMLTTLQKSQFVLSYKTPSDLLTLTYVVGGITAYDLEEPKDKAVIKNFSIGCFSHLNNLDSATIKNRYYSHDKWFKPARNGCTLNAEKISDGTEDLKVEDFYLDGRIYKYEEKYDVAFSSSAKNVNMLSLKNFTYDIQYSVNGINDKMVTLYNKAATAVASAREFGETDREEARKTLLESMASGFSINIEKVNFKHGANMLNFKGRIELVPTPPSQEFSFLTQSKFESNIASEGELAETADLLFGTILGTEVVKNDGNSFNLKLTFDKGVLKINDKEAEPKMTDAINETLMTIDSKLGLSKSLEIVEE